MTPATYSTPIAHKRSITSRIPPARIATAGPVRPYNRPAHPPAMQLFKNPTALAHFFLPHHTMRLPGARGMGASYRGLLAPHLSRPQLQKPTSATCCCPVQTSFATAKLCGNVLSHHLCLQTPGRLSQ